MRFFIGCLVVSLMSSGAAMAQDTTGTTSSTTQASNTVNVTAVTGPQTSIPTKQDIQYSGHTYTTPSVGGSYFGGANPCLVGTGGGAAGGPVGFSLNLGKNDPGCTRRSDAAAWHALGLDGVAVARMCQDAGGSNLNADAFFSSTGFACPGSNAQGRYKLADGSAAPYARIGNAMRLTGPAEFVDPAQKPAGNPTNNVLPGPMR